MTHSPSDQHLSEHQAHEHEAANSCLRTSSTFLVRWLYCRYSLPCHPYLSSLPSSPISSHIASHPSPGRVPCVPFSHIEVNSPSLSSWPSFPKGSVAHANYPTMSAWSQQDCGPEMACRFMFIPHVACKSVHAVQRGNLISQKGFGVFLHKDG